MQCTVGNVMYVGGCFYLICGGLAGEMATGQRETLHQLEGKSSRTVSSTVFVGMYLHFQAGNSVFFLNRG